MRNVITFCCSLILSILLIVGLTNFKKKLINFANPPPKRVESGDQKKPRSPQELKRTVFNYQLLDPEIWQVDPEMEQMPASRSPHYITEFFFRPLQVRSEEPLSLACELQLAQSIEGYNLDMLYTVDRLPKDSYFQITIRTSHNRALMFRCSGFPLLQSGIFLCNEGILDQLADFTEGPHPFPAMQLLPLSIEFGEQSFHFFVDRYDCSTPRLANEQIQGLSIRSGQWPMILDNLSVKTVSSQKSAPSEIKEYLTVYQSFQNPMDPVSIAPRRGTSLPIERLKQHDPKTMTFLPLLIALIIMLISICVIRHSPGWSIILSLITVLPLTLPTHDLIQSPSMVFFVDALLGVLLAGLLTCATSPRHSGMHDANGIPFESSPYDGRRLFLCLLWVILFAIVVWSIVLKSTTITSTWSMLSVILFVCVCASFFLLKEFFQSYPGVIALIVIAILCFAFEYWFAKSPRELLTPVEPLAKPDQITKIWHRGESRLQTTRISRHPSILRILCTGGSSTYGFPFLSDKVPYPAQLESALAECRPHTRIEVLNGGINGFTSFLIRKSLETDLLAYQPNIIILYSRFNDSIPKPRWFTALPALTDQQAWEKYYALSRVPRLYDTQVLLNRFFFYRLLKAFLFSIHLSSASPDVSFDHWPPRGTVEEFSKNLEEIAKLARNNHARLIFIPEVNQYTRTLEEEMAANPYIKAMVMKARSLDVPLVDVITPIAQRRNDDLFIDYIHPSQAGHRFIADRILQTLLNLNWM